MLSRSGGNSTTEDTNKSYEEESKDTTETGKEESLLLAGTGGCLALL